MAIRVALIEDHDDFREAMTHVLQHTPGFRCVGSYASVDEALHASSPADVVLLDIGLPGTSGIEGVRLLRKKGVKAQIVMLTVFEDEKHIFEAIVAGADGYILKKTPPVRILQSIEEAAAGGMPMTPFVARLVVGMFRHRIPVKEPVSLTEREREILLLLVDGFNYAMIAERLFISLDTVRNHIRHIYEKLHVHSKSQAVVKAIRQGII